MIRIHVEDDFAAVGEKFRRGGTLALREINKEMAVMGEEIARVAQGHASSFSSKITVSSRPGVDAAVIEGKSGESPLAVLEELGNAKSKRSAKTFRHPVFGNREVWVEQEKHRYLQPALTKLRPTFRKQMERHLAGALREYGFEVEE